MTSLAILVSVLGWIVLVLAVVGTAYLAAARRVLARFLAQRGPQPIRSEPVTLVKPLYGAEPNLADNLATFLEQDHAGPIQLLLGVQRADDPALGAVAQLRARYPRARIDLVIDGARHGANGKVSNLVNMMPKVAHPTLILSDSDMAVPREYLAQVLAALNAPGVGAVTCLYRGRGDAGWWSRIAAAGPSYQFLVNLVFARHRRLAHPCMGSTIALRRDTLDAIGGFVAFADVLADDHAIGEAVRRHGQAVAVPPLLLTHSCAERSLTAVWRQELRWATTVRDLAPAGHAGSFITIPLPLAMLGALVHPLAGMAVIAATVWVRVATMRLVDRHAQARTAPPWTLLVRDPFSLTVFLASLFTRSVDWRGARLTMAGDGRVTARSENTPS